jgi:hypothetical protein
MITPFACFHLRSHTDELAEYFVPQPPRDMTLHQSVCGTTHEPTARNKFAVFALVACLLVPNAARRLRSTIHHENFRETFEAKEERLPRVIQRYTDSGRRASKKLDALVETLTDRWLFPNNHATADTISFKRPPFPAPHYSGDTTEGLAAVSHDFPSQFPTASDLLDLVQNYGYDIDAALSAMSRAHIWHNPRPDRRRNGGHPTADRQTSGEYASTGFAQPAHPYNPAAPNRRTTQGGGFSRAQVLASVAKMRTSDNVRLACIEVVYRRRSPKAVAEEYGIEWGKLRTYATRVRQRIRGDKAVQKANKNAALEDVVYTV